MCIHIILVDLLSVNIYYSLFMLYQMSNLIIIHSISCIILLSELIINQFLFWLSQNRNY